MAFRGKAAPLAALKAPIAAHRSLDQWHKYNPCPQTGTQTRAVHRWILSAANACKHFKKDAAEAFNFIENGVMGCGRKVDSREIRETIETAYNETVVGERNVRTEKPKFRSDLLEAKAKQVGPHWTEERLAAYSPIPVEDVSPARFLWHLYEPGERVFIGTIKNARKPSALFEHMGDRQDFTCLDHLRDGCEGVWFLNQPVTGDPVLTGEKNEWYPNGEQWRAEENATSWRYLVIESDKAPSDLWIRMLVQLELRIVAIYTSGSRSIHALVRVDRPSKEEWDRFKDKIEERLVALGADPAALKAAQLTRLPGCMRNEPGKSGLQKLLYLDPDADGTPIIKKNLQENEMEENYQEYVKEAERILGKERFQQFQALTDPEFEDLLKELAGGADFVADEADPSDFPIHVVPEQIRGLAKALAEYAKVPVSIPFLSIVAVLSSALGRNLRIQSGQQPRWTPGNLYVLLFVSSGVAKSEVFRHIAKPLQDRYNKDIEHYRSDIEPQLKANLQEIDLQIEAIIRKAKKDDGGKVSGGDSQTLKDLYKDKAKFENRMSPPEYYAEDYTIEALGQILSRNGEQLAAVSPEASKPIQNLKGLYKDGSAEDTIYNKSYSLEAGKVDRINRKSDQFKEPCMSILWMTQPDKIPLIFEDEALLKGGLAPRFITLHESAEIQEISWDTKVIDQGLLDGFDKLWNELFEAYRLGEKCELEEGEDEEAELETPWKCKFKFAKVGTDREVGQVMYDHYNRLVAQRNAELQDIQQFPARWTENAWRLALVFHAAKYGNGSHDTYVELETCQAALTVMDWFSNAQMSLLNRGRNREEKLDAGVDRLYSIVAAEPDKRMTFGQLKDRNCFEPQDLRQLVGKSNGKLKIEESGKTKKKREVVVA